VEINGVGGQRHVEELLTSNVQAVLSHVTTPQKTPSGELCRPTKFGGVRAVRPRTAQVRPHRGAKGGRRRGMVAGRGDTRPAL
jgi:hypothetical protein